jgi:hypothetical protein
MPAFDNDLRPLVGLCGIVPKVAVNRALYTSFEVFELGSRDMNSCGPGRICGIPPRKAVDHHFCALDEAFEAHFRPPHPSVTPPLSIARVIIDPCSEHRQAV